MSKFPLTRRPVSARPIVVSKDEVQINASCLSPAIAALVPAKAAPVEAKASLLGILGLIVVGAVLGLSVYSIVRYLL
jgi:uncharacterized membrane-anchored protein